MTTVSRFASLGSLAGATALALTLALSGCGGQSQPAEEAQTEEAATEEAATAEGEAAETDTTQDKIEIPDIAASSTQSTRTLISSGDTSAAEDFDSLPTREDDELEVDVPDIEEGADSESKAPSGFMGLTEGGIQMAIPGDWRVSRDQDGFVFANADGTFIGFMYASPKKAGTTYDYEAIVRSIPQHELSLGFTGVEIIDDAPLYSASGKVCGHNVIFWEGFDGGEYIHYLGFIESKSYINTIEFIGTPDSYKAQNQNIANALASVVFLDGEYI